MQVALLAEGVDRNWMVNERLNLALVALLAEGVDRNKYLGCFCRSHAGSPSSRRAWIEIYALRRPRLKGYVALLAEGVDRNLLS